VSDELNAAWAAWCDRLKAVGTSISQDAFPQDDRDQAEGFRWLTRLMVHAIQMELEAGDARFPHFVRYETPTNQWGGPNPDNVYLRANIDPNEAYRVWANVAGMRQVIVSLHEGDMQLGEFGVYGEHSLDQLEVDPSGRLEIRIAADEQPGNWILMDPKARILTVRIYQSDWEHDTAPVFHIERIGAEGVPPGPLEPADITRALDRAAHWVEKTAGQHPLWQLLLGARRGPGAAARVRGPRRAVLGLYDSHAGLARIRSLRRQADESVSPSNALRCRRAHPRGRRTPRSRGSQLDRHRESAAGHARLSLGVGPFQSRALGPRRVPGRASRALARGSPEAGRRRAPRRPRATA
jgi:hypothetical protein